MTRREQTERFLALTDQIQSVQARLDDALRVMDYQQVLACQMEIDGLER